MTGKATIFRSCLLLLLSATSLAAPNTLRTFVLRADSGTMLESGTLKIDGPLADIYENWGTYYTATRAGVDTNCAIWTRTRLYSVQWKHSIGPWVIS